MNQISFSTNDIIDYVEPPHILGLMEYINKDSFYTAFVVADTACVLFRVNAKEFMDFIQQDAKLCYQTLIITAHIAKFQYGSCRNTQNFPDQRYPRALPVQTGMLQTAIYMPVNEKGISK